LTSKKELKLEEYQNASIKSAEIAVEAALITDKEIKALAYADKV
jgi:hypothetical protein